MGKLLSCGCYLKCFVILNVSLSAIVVKKFQTVQSSQRIIEQSEWE